MKILLSGASGFVGSHLLGRLIEEGVAVVCIVRPGSDLSDRRGVPTYTHRGDIQALCRFAEQQRFDGVIHLASLFVSRHACEDVPDLINSNLLFSTTLLEAACRGNATWFMNTGTFWQHYRDEAYCPVNLYAATKQAFETVARYYLETTDINFVTLKLNDTFGPGDKRRKILSLWRDHGRSGIPLDMSGGEQLMDLCHIDDVVAAYVRLAHLLQERCPQIARGQSFAVRASERVTLRELAATFEKVTNVTLPINWGARPYSPREVMVPWTTGKIVPGWEPKVSLREGIERTFAAPMENTGG
jgi:nucleoside-diphosphate-sugar epimerase